MRKLVIIALIIFQNFSGFGQVDKFLGNWSAPKNDNSILEITQSKESIISAKIIASDNPEIIGHILMVNGIYSEETDEIKATIISYNSSMSINVTLSLEKENYIKVLGKKYFLQRTYYWNKINNN